jgi:hypothetical protein
MAETLEARVEELEKSVTEIRANLKQKVNSIQWQMTVGTLRDDELSREADRLGREYRQNPEKLSENAGA